MHGNPMRRLQIFSGLVVMIFAAFVCFEASKLPFGTSVRPGPGLLPFGYGALLFIIATIFVGKWILRAGTLEALGSGLWFGVKWRRVTLFLGGLFAYALTLERFGYVLCTWGLMVLLFWREGTRRRLTAIIGGFAVAAMTYLFFRHLLKVRLPAGFLHL